MPRWRPSTTTTRRDSRRRTSWRLGRCWKVWPDVDRGAGQRTHCAILLSCAVFGTLFFPKEVCEVSHDEIGSRADGCFDGGGGGSCPVRVWIRLSCWIRGL